MAVEQIRKPVAARKIPLIAVAFPQVFEVIGFRLAVDIAYMEDIAA